MTTAQVTTPPPPGSSWSFFQGFLLGQITIALLLFAFIKFFIFGEPPSADERATTRAAVRRQRTLSYQRSSNALRRKRSSTILRRENLPLTNTSLLAKTYYNVKGHQPESLDWFNVLIAQTIAQLRDDARQDDAILTSLTDVLNGPAKPDFVSDIRITEISLGEDFPIFSNCRVIPVEDGGLGAGIDGLGPGEGRLQARMDVDLSDMITLGVETKLVLNYPKPFSAVLPVALAVSVTRFSGTLSLSFIPSHQPRSGGARAPTTLVFTFLDDYRLDLSVRSLIGSRSRLQDVPKIAQLIEHRLHAWFDERCVEPRFQQIVLPSFWPRKKNARGGEEEDNIKGDEEAVEDEPRSSPRSSTRGGEETKQQDTPTKGDNDDLEARMAAEGQKIREAERQASQRSSQLKPDAEGMRWRGQDPGASISRNNSSASVNRMPGSLPGS